MSTTTIARTSCPEKNYLLDEIDATTGEGIDDGLAMVEGVVLSESESPL
ncbi:hypothetical protein [Bradyrhizobium yuanmingense]|nr:hypothetical protein [Bradyrhizobium yuanmingense]